MERGVSHHCVCTLHLCGCFWGVVVVINNYYSYFGFLSVVLGVGCSTHSYRCGGEKLDLKL